jgi:ligand-binding sensor domain-containing protein
MKNKCLSKNLRFTVFFVVILSIFFSPNAFSQSGFAYLSHHSHAQKGISKAVNAIVQDNKGVIYTGNRHGVMLYDGAQWEHIRMPGEVHALDFDGSEVWVAGKNIAGKISILATGEAIFQPVTDSTKNYSAFTTVTHLNDKIYFLNSEILLEYDKVQKKISGQWESSLNFDIAAVFVNDLSLWVDVAGKGFMRLEKGKFVESDLKLPGDDEVFAGKTAGKITIIATFLNQLFVFNGNSLKPVRLEDADFISRGEILALEILTDNLAAVGTLKGGCMIFDYTTGKTIQIINESSGLADNEVFAVGKDRNAGIWIGMNKGMARADYSLPFRNFSFYKGLEGQILSVIEFEKTLFVGTTLGLYYLKKIADYEEQTRLVSKEITKSVLKIKPENQESKDSQPATDVKNDEQKEEGSFFQRLRNRRKLKKNRENAAETPINEAQPTVYEPVIEQEVVSVTEVQKFMQLKTVSYRFEKIKNIDGKCIYLFSYDNQLLAGTHAGLFSVTGKQAKRILDQAVSFMIKQESAPRVWASTKNNTLISLLYENGAWRDENYYSDFYDRIRQVVFDAQNNVWVCGRDYVYKMQVDRYWQIENREAYKVKNPYSDEITPFRHEGKLFFAVKNNAFFYDTKSNSLKSDKIMTDMLGKDAELLSENSDYLIAHRGRNWRVFTEKAFESKNLELLNVFDNIENIFISNSKEFWFVKNNQLYNFEDKGQKSKNFSYNLLLQRIFSNETALPLGELVLDFQNNSLAFSFKLPDYLNSNAIEYQYFLEGKMDNWSSWSKNSNIIFYELEAGNYQLHVKARDAFGSEKLIKPIPLKVKPPFWKTWWFYACAMSIFALLVFVASRMNERAANRQSRFYKFFSRFMTLLTLIMCLEFTKVVLVNIIDVGGSPVIDFGMEVLMAFVLFPVELMLSYFIFKSKDNKN